MTIMYCLAARNHRNSNLAADAFMILFDLLLSHALVQVVQVYANGSLADGWHDSSKGCMKCTWASTSEVGQGRDSSA